jgi:hypothetical protein
MDRGDWRHIINKFAKDVEHQQDASSSLEMIRKHFS